MIMTLQKDYGIIPLWSLSIFGAETSMGRPEDALSLVFNFGCIRYNPETKDSPWGRLALEIPVHLNDRDWLAFSDAWTGIAAWGRLIKLEYLDLLRSGGVAAAVPKYYGVTVEGYSDYLANVIRIEAAVKASLDAYVKGAA